MDDLWGFHYFRNPGTPEPRNNQVWAAPAVGVKTKVPPGVGGRMKDLKASMVHLEEGEPTILWKYIYIYDIGV